VIPVSGIDLIAWERSRHEDLGHTTEHDRQHHNGELLAAAICYTVAGAGDAATSLDPTSDLTLYMWPWEQEQWKPSLDVVRNLVKAGALLAAEIDRVSEVLDLPYSEEPSPDGSND
jgi:hypothetical protein